MHNLLFQQGSKLLNNKQRCIYYLVLLYLLDFLFHEKVIIASFARQLANYVASVSPGCKKFVDVPAIIGDISYIIMICERFTH